VRDLDGVLVDHAHCEMKAATNALSLAVRHPGDLGLVRALTRLAEEELDHFRRVVDVLEARGLALGVPPVDDYAADLRRAASRLRTPEIPLAVDRLLVSALIEARSCERFKLLLEVLPPDVPHDLAAFYRELFEAEARHYRTYVDLATWAARAGGIREDVAPSVVDRRLATLADEEAAIVRALGERETRATIHG
jgi:tRNA-(ms[2]io[6]A)-hydroxylase